MGMNISLKETDPERFRKITEKARYFQTTVCGTSILKDNIFQAAESYVRRSGRETELLFYPFECIDILALNMIREDTFFLSINTERPVYDEIYAAANELWRISRYIESDDEGGLYSILTKEMTESPESREDMEADTFARILLMSDSQIYEMTQVHDIYIRKPNVGTIVLLMSLFAVSFRTAVIRLFEYGSITEEQALALLAYSGEEIKNEIKKRGTGIRWSLAGKGTEHLGSFVETYEYNKENGFLTDGRIRETEEFLEEIRRRFEI